MKLKEKQEARRLRKEEGLSLKSIAEKLKVSKGSVSRWVNDVKLTKAQQKVLEHNFKVKNTYEARIAGARTNKEQARKKHLEWQRHGRDKAKEQDPLHLMGCTLYWCEGYRKNNRNSVMLANSDPNLLRVFVRFLKKNFSIKNDEIRLKLNHYDDLVSLKKAEEHWLHILRLPRSCVRKATLNVLSKYSKKKRCGTLKYGTCAIMLHRTDVIQHIYGALQEYGGFVRREWA